MAEPRCSDNVISISTLLQLASERWRAQRGSLWISGRAASLWSHIFSNTWRERENEELFHSHTENCLPLCPDPKAHRQHHYDFDSPLSLDFFLELSFFFFKIQWQNIEYDIFSDSTHGTLSLEVWTRSSWAPVAQGMQSQLLRLRLGELWFEVNARQKFSKISFHQ